MKKTRISSLIDYIFYYFSIFFISLIWIRLFLHNAIINLILSFVIATVVIVLIILKNKVKYNKNSISEKQKQLANSFALNMSFLTTKEQSTKICKIFNINVSCIKKTMIFSRDCVIIPLFNYKICTYDQLLNLFIKVKNEKVEKVIFLTNEYEDALNDFHNSYNDIKICILDKYDFYKIIEPLNVEIKVQNKVKIPKKEKINNMLNVAFNRAKSKNYFIYGIILFICCLFFRYNVYYIIFSSLMFCFSLFSRFNRKYNKPKLKTIDIVSETLKQ